MNVVLIDPPSFYDDQVNLGPVSLASYLESLGHSVRVVDMNFHKSDNYDRLFTAMNQLFPVGLVGISIMTFFAFPEVKRVMRWVRTFHASKIVVGGASPSLYADKMMQENPEIDFAVIGEGEHTLAELIERLSIENESYKPQGEFYNGYAEVKGLAWRDVAGTVAVNSPRPFIEPLDSLPLLNFDLIDLVKKYGFKYYRDTFTVCSSRGCPFSCEFCLSSILCHRRWRAFSAKRVVDEIENGYKKYGLTRVSFQDDNFVMKPQRVIDMCQMIGERGLKIKLCLEGGIRADRVTPESLRAMQGVGLEDGFLGVESGSPKVFEHVNKGETLAEIERTLVMLKRTGMDLQVYMILGLPYETHETHMESLAFVRKHGVKGRWHFAYPFEKTRMYDYVKEHGRFLRKVDGYDLDIVTDNDITSRGTVPLAFDTPEYPKEQRIGDYYRAVIESEAFWYITFAKYQNYVACVVRTFFLVLKYRPGKLPAYIGYVFRLGANYLRLKSAS